MHTLNILNTMEQELKCYLPANTQACLWKARLIIINFVEVFTRYAKNNQEYSQWAKFKTLKQDKYF